jgi:hypothetical protein
MRKTTVRIRKSVIRSRLRGSSTGKAETGITGTGAGKRRRSTMRVRMTSRGAASPLRVTAAVRIGSHERQLGPSHRVITIS